MSRSSLYLIGITALLVIVPHCFKEQAASMIVEADTITAIYHYLSPEDFNGQTLIVFDIDNTLAHPITDLGSDQWFSSLVADNIASGQSVDCAVQSALEPYYYAQHHVWLQPIEPETVPTLKALQDRGITVIALTARGLFLIYRTIAQLQRIGIDFTKTSPCDTVNPYESKSPALYINGIIFASHHDKGEVLKHWLKQLRYHPHKIIFVDDKLKNIISVQKGLKRLRCPFIGIRYGTLDQSIRNFNKDKTAQEYKQLLLNNPDSQPVPII